MGGFDANPATEVLFRTEVIHEYSQLEVRRVPVGNLFGNLDACRALARYEVSNSIR